MSWRKSRAAPPSWAQWQSGLSRDKRIAAGLGVVLVCSLLFFGWVGGNLFLEYWAGRMDEEEFKAMAAFLTTGMLAFNLPIIVLLVYFSRSFMLNERLGHRWFFQIEQDTSEAAEEDGLDGEADAAKTVAKAAGDALS